MKFKWPLLFASLVCFLVGMWDWSNELPASDVVFSSSNIVKIYQLKATSFTPARGTPRILVSDFSGGSYVIDCLTHAQLCNKGSQARDTLLDGTLFKLEGQFYWPVEANFASGRVLGRSESKVLFELFRERDGQFYRIWIALSASLLAFSLWFGRRSMFA